MAIRRLMPPERRLARLRRGVGKHIHRLGGFTQTMTSSGKREFVWRPAGALFALLFALAPILASAASAGPEIVSEIEFQGAKSLSRSRLESMIKSRVGEPYDADRVREDLKALDQVARAPKALRAPTADGVKLTFVLQENPVVGEISVVGNSVISTKRIVATLPVKAGEPLPSDGLAQCKMKILKDYRAAGHMQAEVRVNAVDRSDGGVNLQILINEGERLKIKDIDIRGASNISKTRIRWAMDNKGSWFVFSNYFDEFAFEEDLQAIERLYKARGFFDAVVSPGEFLYDEGKKEVTPVVMINEGPRYTVRSVTVEGATIFSQPEVQKPFEGMAGKPYDGQKMAAALEKLKALYFNEGFLLTEARESYDFDRAAAEMAVSIKIVERQRVRVGNVIVDRDPYDVEELENMGVFGRAYSKISPPVKGEALEREMKLRPGEVYRKNLEEETVDRLERLGIFDSVEAHSEPTEDEGVRDLVITVEEGVTGRVIFGVGFGDATGVFVFGEYTERNLFGDARDLRARVLIGTDAITGEITYYDRFLREDGSDLMVTLFKSLFRRRGYDEDEIGLMAEVGVPRGEYLRDYYRARVGYVSTDLDEDYAGEEDDDNNEELEDELSDYPVIAARIRRVLDTRGPNKDWPSEGQTRAGGLEVGYADGPLVKLTGQFSYYRQLQGSLIYRLNTEGALMPFDASDVGISERLFLGGTEDLRGFAYRGAGPMAGKDDDVPIGGSTKLLVQNELRFTILENMGFSRRPTPLNGLVFADAGMLGRGPLELDSPRASIGAGLRINMKHFNVGVDFALPVLKQSDDLEQYIHFKISSAF